MINDKLDNIMRKLDTILAFHDEGMPLAHSSPDLLPLFPLKSTADLKTFCENLDKDEDLRKQFVSVSYTMEIICIIEFVLFFY